MTIRYIVKLYCPKDSKKLFYEYKTEFEERAAREDAEDYLKKNGKMDCEIKLIPTSPKGDPIVKI